MSAARFREIELEVDTNDLGQPIGAPVPNWTPPAPPSRVSLIGRCCKVEPLDCNRHGAGLFESNALDTTGATWTYLAYGPFDDFASYTEWLKASEKSLDPNFYAIVDQSLNRPVGIASYLRIDPKSGSIEIGHLHFSPLLQRTCAATEAIYLMMKNAFNLGYRRLEWKCNALNAPSRRAAERFGLKFEGVFRQALIVKGRNRDTAWYSALDSEWPAIDAAFTRWLDLANFDGEGKQIEALSKLMESARKDNQ